MHDYNQIAAIVGEDKIAALRKIGVDIGNKPDKPTTGLLGRWVKDLNGKDMVICDDKPDKSGLLVTAWVAPKEVRGTGSFVKNIDELTFPEETTRPEDVPVGEAWLVNTCDGLYVKKNTVAFKLNERLWVTGSVPDGSAETRWDDYEVELIAPLIPARPMDSDRERKYWEQ